MADTSIEWTDKVWNPVRGCSIVSPGCTNCYAMRQAHRFSGAGGPYEGLTKLTKGGPVWTDRVITVPELLEKPLRWRKPARIFVNSMSDLFHQKVPFSFIKEVWDVIAQAQHHTFQILTKRPERLLEFHRWLAGGDDLSITEWPRNAWIGVSVEDQRRADERIPLLVRTPAAVRWISAEPLLGQVDITPWLRRVTASDPRNPLAHDRLDWVVAGGESGPGARPVHPDWLRQLRDDCAANSVPFFFKQWGAWRACWTDVDVDRRSGRIVEPQDDDIALEREGPYEVVEAHGTEFVRVGKKAAGRELDGRTHDDYPA